MFENVSNFFKKVFKKDNQKESNSGKEAKERLHLVLMQDRANVSADFLEMMKQEIIEVIKKYIDVDENSIDVRLTNQPNEDGSNGAPALYANIPIISIKEEQKENVDNETQNTEKKADNEVENSEEEINEDKQEEIIENTENTLNEQVNENKEQEEINNEEQPKEKEESKE